MTSTASSSQSYVTTVHRRPIGSAVQELRDPQATAGSAGSAEEREGGDGLKTGVHLQARPSHQACSRAPAVQLQVLDHHRQALFFRTDDTLRTARLHLHPEGMRLPCTRCSLKLPMTIDACTDKQDQAKHELCQALHQQRCGGSTHQTHRQQRLRGDLLAASAAEI